MALPKGRVLDEAVALLGRAGYDISAVLADTRRLVFRAAGFEILVVKPMDVPTYVEHGAADLGIAGLDVLEEEDADVYQPLDLGIGRCRLAVAEPAARPIDERAQIHLRIATKYVRVTTRWLQQKGLHAEVIKLSGSIELAPLIGLADRIVDLVSTGETLRANALREVEAILPVTSRLIVNRASLKLRGAAIDQILGRLRKVL
ncbi:MAG TPA: ATP phosphoribosyltransferase [Haliangiales bacterium]|nr:ATP phosphoribosyltransferase [Haliangiales bacterium]